MFEIEKGVPIADMNHRGRASKYPLLGMEKGDSFFVATVNGGTSKAIQSVHNAAYRLRPKRFTVRKVDGGVRCWRVE